MEIILSKIQVQLPNRERRLLFRLPSLKIASGAKVLIQGPSGRGKTTLLHMIAGLFLPFEGTVQAGNFTLNSLSDEERCRFRLENVGIVFQRLNLLDHLTAGENVQLGQAHPASIETVRGSLARLGLEKRSDDIVGKMSVGEQQRVAIARVLAARPKLILADEPTSSLDEHNAFAVIDALIKTEPKATLVVVSHDERIASRFELVLKFEELLA